MRLRKERNVMKRGKRVQILLYALIISALFISSRDVKADSEIATENEIYIPVIKQYQEALANGLYLSNLERLTEGTGDNNEYNKICENYLKERGEYLEYSIFVYAQTANEYRLEKESNNSTNDFDILYSFSDLNNDGRDEMFIAGRCGNDLRIFNILLNDGINIIPLFEVNSIGWRQSLEVFLDNSFMLADSRGSENKVFYLTENSYSPDLKEEYAIDYNTNTVTHYDAEGNCIEDSISINEFIQRTNSMEKKDLMWSVIKSAESYPDASVVDASALKLQAIEDVKLVEQQVEEIENMSVYSQHESNQNLGHIFELWDNVLNVIWGYLKQSLSPEKMEQLRNEELVWIQEKEAASISEGEKFKGGALQPIASLQKEIELTKERVYVLLDKLS